jgi:hypothetical protein
MKTLEEDVEKSLQREESKLDAEEQSYPDDVQKVAQELKSKYNVSIYFVASVVPLTTGNCQLEIEQLRKRMGEMEMKHARVVHDVRPLVYYYDHGTYPSPVRSFTKR